MYLLYHKTHIMPHLGEYKKDIASISGPPHLNTYTFYGDSICRYTRTEYTYSTLHVEHFP